MAKSGVVRAGVARSIFNEVREFCIAKADSDRVRKYARFFVEGYDAYGVDHRDPDWERNRREWSARLRAAGPTAFLDAGDLLVETGKYEETSFAILFAEDSAEFYTPAAFDRIAKWFERGIRNWGHTDVLSGEVLSDFLLRGVVPVSALESWRDSKLKYQRRAVPVSLIEVLGTTKDFRPLLALIEPLMRDPEKVVQQGTGWFLREAWKRQPKQIEKFLLAHKETAPRLIIQYATEKMDPVTRTRFRRTK